MKNRYVMLVAGFLVFTLLFGSCSSGGKPATKSPAPATNPTTSATPGRTTSPAASPSAAPASSPQYGGTVIAALDTPIQSFDDTSGALPWQSFDNDFVREELYTGDWAKGPAGSGKTDWITAGTADVEWPLEVPCLAESWKMPDPQTIVFTIRKGVHWQNKPPVNGRELTAEDVKFTIEYLASTGSYMQNNYLKGWLQSVECTDNWTVVVHAVPVKEQKNPSSLVATVIAELMPIIPPEVIKQYGNMKDWKNIIGTGPFTITDYLPQDHITFTKNPEYWRTDPLHPQNKLPYIDEFKLLIIEDPSTRLAAMRSWKVDQIDLVDWETGKHLTTTNPEIKWTKSLHYQIWNLYMRTDKPELPFYDIRVRQALAMAIDYPNITQKYFGGDAETLAFPLTPYPAYMDMYTPLKDLPESSRELFEFHPDKAKKLLADAGYPTGFKTEVVCQNEYVEILSLVKSYFADIGVDMELKVLEYGAWNSICTQRKHTEMAMRFQGVLLPFKLLPFKPNSAQNLSIVNDPKVNQVLDDLWKFENVFDEPKRREMMKDINKYIIDQAWVIPMPLPYVYTFWTPWLGDYHGERRVGSYNAYSWCSYIWVDQNMKQQMARSK